MRLRDATVLARCDDEGALRVRGGRVEVRYGPTSPKAYAASPRNLEAIEGGADRGLALVGFDLFERRGRGALRLLAEGEEHAATAVLATDGRAVLLDCRRLKFRIALESKRLREAHDCRG